MWWKLVLLTLYLLVLFALSRILEAFSYYEGSYFASKLLNPVSLSVRRLKAILDQRGVSYTGVLERKELTDLVKSSGDVATVEMETAALSLASDVSSEVVTSQSVDDISVSCTNFTCGSHFYEEVEDTKDSVWVVQVHRYRRRLLMPHTEWKSFVKKVSQFGVRTGIFDCSLDPSLCDRKKWHDMRLVLAMPVGYQAKDHVVLKSYTGSPQVHAVQAWLNNNLAARITKIQHGVDLHHSWLHFQQDRRPKHEKVRVLLFSELDLPPMFFSALSVKFTGRVKFGMVDVRTTEGQQMAKTLSLTTPSYVVLTPEANYTYGSGVGEFLTYQSMALFLRTLHPEVNDMFLLSLIVINAACCLEFFITRGNVLKRTGRVLWDIVKWNFLLILLWLPVLGLFQLPYMDHVFNCMLSVLRRLSMTSFAACLRSDWLWFSSLSWVLRVLTFLAFAIFIGFLRCLGCDRSGGSESAQSSGDQTSSGGFWSFQWDSYVSSLLQPSGHGSFHHGSAMYGGGGMYGMDVELLIERLAVPNLWLRPMISSQYVHSLPVWKYTGPCCESDIGSDSECPSDSSSSTQQPGTKDASAQCGGNRPLMFVCEKCRMLQQTVEAQSKTAQELEQERMESESACAKYLMDGNYKCQCGGQAGEMDHAEGGAHGSRRGSPQKDQRCKAHGKSCGNSETKTVEDSTQGIPVGMIATMDCSICLESYKAMTLLCGLPCGHTFHQQCIFGWLTRDNHCCPICRWPAYKAKPCNIHQHSD